MSLYGDAVTAIRSIILLEERIQSLTGKIDKLSDEVRQFSERLTRLETVIEITRPEGSVLRLVPPPSEPPRR
jgi:hypothetical protein